MYVFPLEYYHTYPHGIMTSHQRTDTQTTAQVAMRSSTKFSGHNTHN